MAHHRLLEIAIAEFGTRGLDGASTRSIAAAAGTAMSSITYHFGGKEGLYLAAAEYIAVQIGEHMAPAIPPDNIPETLTAPQARALIHQILERFIDAMAAPKSSAWSLFIVREQMEPSAAFERIYGGMMGRMLETLVALVRIATDRHDAPVSQIAVFSLIGQVVALRASRATLLKLLDTQELDVSAIDAVKRRIIANTDAILDQMIAEPQELQ